MEARRRAVDHPDPNPIDPHIMPHALQCPRCSGAVSVPDQAAGERVKCPHCEQSFLAPGFAPSDNDDDDWLVLDSEPDLGQIETGGTSISDHVDSSQAGDSAGEKRSTGSPAKDGPEREAGKPQPGKKKLTPEEEALLAEFSSDLDEFTSEVESPPPPPESSDPFDDLPPVSAGVQPMQPQTSASPPPSAQPVEYESEFRVKCPICGSIVYAKATQAGKTVKCSDCYSPIKVPAAPRKKKKSEIDIEDAETFTLEHRDTKQRSDPFQRSAEELLAEASRVDEKKEGPLFDDVPSIKEWFKGVFGIFLDPSVVVHWLGLSVLAAVPAYVALSFDNPVLILGLMAAGFFLGAIVVACGFAILQSVANEEESVSEWPVFDPMAWLGQLFVAVAAAFVAAAPAWFASTFVFGPSLTSAAITMVSVYAIFPFVILSMLDMESAFVPFSPEVARSVSKCEEAWGGFYFSSGLLFVGLFLFFTLTSTLGGPGGAVLAIFVTIALTFVYFSMIGRLAYAIGQSVNAPPMKNDIDRDQHTRPRDGSIR